MYDNLPHVVSYPRSGSNYLGCVLELYSGKSRLFRPGRAPIYLPATSLLHPATEPSWVSSHDPDCPPRPRTCVLLCRDPMDVLYSYSVTRGITRPVQLMAWVKQYAGEWAWHYHRWSLVSNMIVHYETVSPSEIMQIASLFGWPLDRSKAIASLQAVTKPMVTAAAPTHLSGYFNEQLATGAYSNGRAAFKETYGGHILNAIASVREELY